MVCLYCMTSPYHLWLILFSAVLMYSGPGMTAARVVTVQVHIKNALAPRITSIRIKENKTLITVFNSSQDWWFGDSSALFCCMYVCAV